MHAAALCRTHSAAARTPTVAGQLRVAQGDTVLAHIEQGSGLGSVLRAPSWDLPPSPLRSDTAAWAATLAAWEARLWAWAALRTLTMATLTMATLTTCRHLPGFGESSLLAGAERRTKTVTCSSKECELVTIAAPMFLRLVAPHVGSGHLGSATAHHTGLLGRGASALVCSPHPGAGGPGGGGGTLLALRDCLIAARPHQSRQLRPALTCQHPGGALERNPRHDAKGQGSRGRGKQAYAEGLAWLTEPWRLVLLGCIYFCCMGV